MTIAICASLKAHQKILNVRDQLKKLKFKVIMPWGTERLEVGDWHLKTLSVYKNKHKSWAVTNHFNKIKQADAVLVVNQTKNAVKNYIGGNTLMEIGFAYYLKKPIYLLNPIPKLSYTEEIKAVQPVILNGNLSQIYPLIKNFKR